MGSIIKFDYKIDKDLIGGLKLQLGSFMIDTSIKNKLKKFFISGLFSKRYLKLFMSVSIFSRSAASLATSNSAREYLSEASVEKDLFALIFCC